jgi:hypothetical protein
MVNSCFIFVSSCVSCRSCPIISRLASDVDELDTAATSHVRKFSKILFAMAARSSSRVSPLTANTALKLGGSLLIHSFLNGSPVIMQFFANSDIILRSCDGFCVPFTYKLLKLRFCALLIHGQ